MLKSKIESLLFIAGKPLNIKKLSELTGADKKETAAAADELLKEFNEKNSGIKILKNGQEYQMASAPEMSKLVKDYIKDETTGELTKPSLETLTIIAYRQPVTKAELEQIRGVNCSLILRNLLIRGLIESEENKKTKAINYSVTFDFLRFLGINEISELPDYEKLNSDENLTKLLMPEKPKEISEKDEGEKPQV